MLGIYINYWAVLVAAVASYAFAWVWHGPLFGKKWMKLWSFTKQSTDNMTKRMGSSMFLGFINTFVFAWGLAYLIGAVGVFGISGALMLALVVLISFVTTMLAGGWLWEGKSGKLFGMNFAYQLISIVIMTVVLMLL